MRTEMTVIERCSLSPRSHPLVDSVSGQSLSAISVSAAARRIPTSFSCTVSEVVDTQMLGLGSYVLHSIANVFTFDLTTGLRHDILTPRGSIDRRLATCAVHRRMRASPLAAEIGGGVRRATAHFDRRSKGRHLDEVAIGERGPPWRRMMQATGGSAWCWLQRTDRFEALVN